MSFKGSSIVPWVIQVPNNSLFQSIDTTYTTIILKAYYLENPNSKSQFFIFTISDGVYSIPVLVDSESVKEQFGFTTLDSNVVKQLYHKVISIHRSTVSVYRIEKLLAPYIIALNWKKMNATPMSVDSDIKDIVKNDRVKQWIRSFKEFGLSGDERVSSFFQKPYIEKLFHPFHEIEDCLEKIVAAQRLARKKETHHNIKTEVQSSLNVIAHQDDTDKAYTPPLTVVTTQNNVNESRQTNASVNQDNTNEARQNLSLSTLQNDIIKVNQPLDIVHPLPPSNYQNHTIEASKNRLKASTSTLKRPASPVESLALEKKPKVNTSKATTVKTSPFTKLSKEELEKQLETQTNKLNSIAMDSSTDSFNRLHVLSRLRFFQYITYCDN